jgi:hypothetical protein
MTIEKKLIIDDALHKLFGIRRYQDELTPCLDESYFVLSELRKMLQDFPRGFTLDDLNDILQDFPRDFQACIEKLNPLLDVAYKLEGLAIAHRQNIQELCEVMTKIEKPQGNISEVKNESR